MKAVSVLVKRRRQAELACQAAMFFAQPAPPEETEERADWEALGLEVLSRDEPVARRGEVWLAAMPDESNRRPCVVLSADWLNQHALDDDRSHHLFTRGGGQKT